MDPEELDRILNEEIARGELPPPRIAPASDDAPEQEPVQGSYITMKQLADLSAQHGGYAGMVPTNPTIKNAVGISKPNPNPTYRYTFGDGTYMEAVMVHAPSTRADEWGEVIGVSVSKSGTALTTLREQAKAPTTRQGPDGREYQWDAETNQWILAPGIPGVAADPNADLNRELLQARINAANRGPLGRQLTPAELTKQELDVAKAQRELANPYILAMQQRDEAIATIKQQLNNKDIDFATADRLMALTNSNVEAALQGTSPWAIEQARQKRRGERATLASSLLQNQQNTASSLTTGLLSGLSGVYGKVFSSVKPPAIDLFDLVEASQQQAGGGQGFSNMLSGFLSGELRQE